MLLPALLTLLTTASPAFQPLGTASYALVITNNRSLNASHADLHFADDDGAKYATLFAQVMGTAHVTLLTQFDVESRALFGDWASSARPPTRANVVQAVAHLAAELAGDRAAGRVTEVHVVFAGHGDIENGQGYVELLDGKLTARDLEELIIRPLPATHVHLILDSCNSYFMLNPRKPGGTRFASTAKETEGLLARFPNVGALVSTSAEAVTYEWSEVQSGIFSYEVRSGLRGAADVNGDGKVSYAELTAFINVANKPIVNDLYRPKVFSSAPSRDPSVTLFTLLSPNARLLRVPSGGERRFTVRDEEGTRVLDVHKEDGTALALMLPQRGALGVYETQTLPGEDRPELKFHVLDFAGEASLDSLDEKPVAIASRGEAPVFKSLFAAPFGTTSYLEATGLAVPDDPDFYGITRQDVERLRMHLKLATESLQSQRIAVGLMFGWMSLGRISEGLGGISAPPTRFLGALNLGLGGAFLIGGLTVPFLVHPPQQDIYERFLTEDVSTEQARAVALLSTELRFRALAKQAAKDRETWSTIAICLGALESPSAILSLRAGTPQEKVAVWFGLVDAAAFVVGGLLYRFVYRDPAEVAWHAYLSEPDVGGRRDVTTDVVARTFRATPTLLLTRTGAAAPGFAVAGQF